jgi:hypothetical protein
MEKENLKRARTIQQGNVTVDAVHPRLLDKSKHPQNCSSSLETSADVLPVYCLQCNENIGRTVAALRNHFESTPHESQPCVYCCGPVYKYIFRSEENFHECISNAMQGRESDNTSSLSEDEGNDTSEVQSISSTQNIETRRFYVQDTDIQHS